MRLVRDPKIELLAGIELFAGLDADDLATIGSVAEQTTIPRHTELTSEGTRAELVYVIIDGIAQVRRGDTVLAYLGDGDVVGELAMLDDRRRRSTVTTIVDTEALVIDRRHLGPLLQGVPRLAERIERIARPRRAA